VEWFVLSSSWPLKLEDLECRIVFRSCFSKKEPGSQRPCAALVTKVLIKIHCLYLDNFATSFLSKEFCF
jgi:hypothetical protein